MNGNPEYASDPHQALNQCVEVVPEVPDDPSFFQRTDWLSFLITAVLALAVYLFTLAPEVTLEYSGIYATGAMYGGVPHAGGYPLWTIYAWLSTKLLPFSNIAWRVGVSSAVAAALACGITALMVSRGGALSLEGIAGSSRLRPKEENLLRMVSGYVAGMAFGFDGAFWGNAVTVETWPLTLLLFSIVLCFVMRWLAAPEKTRYLSAAALAYGLTLTTSQALAIAALGLQFVILLGNRAVGRDIFLATTLLVIACLIARTREFFPGILHVLRVDSLWRVYVCIGIATGLMCIGLTLRTRSILTRWRTVVAVGFFLATGLSVYFYVPTVSMTNPPMNWGYARTVEGFVQTLSRGQFEGIRPTDSLARLVAGMRFYTDRLVLIGTVTARIRKPS